MGNRFKIRCCRCKSTYPNETGLILCPKCSKSSLLQTIHSSPLKVSSRFSNLYRYQDVLPVQSYFENISSIPGCYRSRHLARELGLDHLWILFSGYWPEKGAYQESCSFKEFEAIGVLSRFSETTDQVPIICSAGNTALSALSISQKIKIPVIIVAPESACVHYKLSRPLNRDSAFLISLKHATYKDCMAFVSDITHRIPGVVPSGGVYNIARRDFLGIPMIHGVQTVNKIPDHYFQAVGSGTGAIAAWEAVKRLTGSGLFPKRTTRLHLAQNSPFTPIADQWENRPFNDQSKADQVLARVLTNPDPPFNVAGGIRDALSETSGQVYRVTNEEIIESKKRFERLEGCDIQYPAAASVAALTQAVEARKVNPEETVFLHITGGGQNQLEQAKPLFSCNPALSINKNDVETAAMELNRFLTDLNGKSV